MKTSLFPPAAAIFCAALLAGCAHHHDADHSEEAHHESAPHDAHHRSIAYAETIPLESVSPVRALERLKAGNARYATGRIGADVPTPAEHALHATGQNPYAIVLSCADSRVPVERVFDAGAGEIFTLRVAGNVATEEVIGSAEFAVLALKTPLFVVMGHSSCGAVEGALSLKPGTEASFPPSLQNLLEDIGEGLTDGADRASTDAAVEANVRRQMAALLEVPAFAEAVAAGSLNVVGGVYDLSTGKVRFL